MLLLLQSWNRSDTWCLILLSKIIFQISLSSPTQWPNIISTIYSGWTIKPTKHVTQNQKTNHTVGDRHLDGDLDDSIGSDLAAISAGGLAWGSWTASMWIIIAVMKRKKIFSTNQEWDNETLIIIKPIMAYLFLNLIVITSSIMSNPVS